MFDQLLLFGTGETVSCGPVTRVKDYFEFLHEMFEANANLADFIIDVKAGIIHEKTIHRIYLPIYPSCGKDMEFML